MFLSTSPKVPQSFLGGMLYLIKQYYPMFLEGIKYTLIISLVGTVIGLVIALFIAPLKIQTISKRDNILVKLTKKVSLIFTFIYVEVLRGTPMIVQSVIFYYGLSSLGYQMNIILCGILIVSINTSAYITEVLRGSINAIDKGQMEAARSLGMSSRQAMIHVIIPQAFKNSIPAIGNEFVINIKDTAVLSVISVTELFSMTRKVNSIHYRQVEGFAITAIIYLILTFSTTQLLYYISKKLGNSKPKSYPTSQSM